MRIARALELNAINAMQVAQVLLKRVDKAAVNLTRMPELSHFSAGEPNGPGGEPWSLGDQLTLTVRGPLVNGDHAVQETDIDDDYLIRLGSSSRGFGAFLRAHMVSRGLRHTSRQLDSLDTLNPEPSLPPSLPLSSLSASLSLSLTLSLSLSLSLPLPLTLTHSLTHSLSLSLSV